MQDAGSKKDMALNSEGLSLSSRELPVQSLGHCQSVGNWIAPSSVVKALHGHSIFRFLFAGKTSCQRTDNHSIRGHGLANRRLLAPPSASSEIAWTGCRESENFSKKWATSNGLSALCGRSAGSLICTTFNRKYKS
jgi:hypothetical protein